MNHFPPSAVYMDHRLNLILRLKEDVFVLVLSSSPKCRALPPKKVPRSTPKLRPGDFILIPPLAPHQVWNRGTRTMKIAWNRTTAETLEMAINKALPNSRIVCRNEQYKNKAIVYYTLQKYSSLLKSTRAQVEMGGDNAESIQRSIKVRQVQKDFKKLFDLYKSILLSEMFAPDSREHPELLPYDNNVTCTYCRCNIFNRFLSCKSCKNLFSSEIEEPYDVCMECYCMGRSCGCQSGHTWVEQWKWKDLIHKYDDWRAQIIDIDGHMTDKTPLPLQEERRYRGTKVPWKEDSSSGVPRAAAVEAFCGCQESTTREQS
ncbi:hypothetical protein IQ06DRAFT_365736 [Phaeosphaeriaceae sp. SRC1lsM3a]|nr:hypothetical protein IQ06DRAFT_365736 [Stagonospora sp. SRC1lsM3a]